MAQAFHLALPVQDLAKAKKFYIEILGAKLKRSSFNWVDIDFYGNQVSLHLVTSKAERPESTMIDGDPCLLYTSPSPRDKRQSRMPSSA